MPTADAIDTEGLDIEPGVLAQLLRVDPESWRQELPQLEQHYAGLGSHVPAALKEQLEALEKRLAAS